MPANLPFSRSTQRRRWCILAVLLVLVLAVFLHPRNFEAQMKLFELSHVHFLCLLELFFFEAIVNSSYVGHAKAGDRSHKEGKRATNPAA